MTEELPIELEEYRIVANTAAQKGESERLKDLRSLKHKNFKEFEKNKVMLEKAHFESQRVEESGEADHGDVNASELIERLLEGWEKSKGDGDQG